MMETLNLTSADETSDRSEVLPVSRPRTCARCRFWGAHPHEKASDRWRLCLQQPVGLAHQDYWCPSYERRARA
jgi:hypothetical protein